MRLYQARIRPILFALSGSISIVVVIAEHVHIVYSQYSELWSYCVKVCAVYLLFGHVCFVCRCWLLLLLLLLLFDVCAAYAVLVICLSLSLDLRVFVCVFHSHQCTQ